jgi:hypothetical protein
MPGKNPARIHKYPFPKPLFALAFPSEPPIQQMENVSILKHLDKLRNDLRIKMRS